MQALGLAGTSHHPCGPCLTSWRLALEFTEPQSLPLLNGESLSASGRGWGGGLWEKSP